MADIPAHSALELETLRAIFEGTAGVTGDAFFHELVRNLAIATGVRNAFVARFAEDRTRVRAVVFWERDHFLDDVEWPLVGTPCEEVVGGQFCHYPSGVSQRFPNEPGVESYLGVPLRAATGEVIGHMAVFDDRPMPDSDSLLYLFQIFAARASSEFERLRMEEALRLSEARLDDLFEEAPIAYVHEDLDSRFIRANRTALKVLGIRPDEVAGMRGKSLAPNTPEAQQRLQMAFESIGRGVDTSGVVLELSRKDTGKPLWIEWWSRPDPSGQFTRTMFLDITSRVLMEQEQARLQAQNRYLQDEIKAVHNFDEIVGSSSALTRLLKGIERVAATDATVLVWGETGTGKELIARAIHSASPRRDKPLIKVNCAALPTHLLESELFGHEKGAFTGAIARRQGRFELADGGTLFLDEIGELPLDMQAKLLRVLQEREFERVGGERPLKVDIRVIAATNRDLQQAVQDRTFREDLYYRLNVFPVQLPPLRERREDIPALVQHLLEKLGPKLGLRVQSVDPASLQRLRAYQWPGNVRELENVIERALILSDGITLTVDADMLPGLHDNPTLPSPVETLVSSDSLEDVERAHIRAMLEKAHWIIEGPTGAAALLNMHPSTLRYRIRKLGIARPALR